MGQTIGQSSRLLFLFCTHPFHGPVQVSVTWTRLSCTKSGAMVVFLRAIGCACFLMAPVGLCALAVRRAKKGKSQSPRWFDSLVQAGVPHGWRTGSCHGLRTVLAGKSPGMSVSTSSATCPVGYELVLVAIHTAGCPCGAVLYAGSMVFLLWRVRLQIWDNLSEYGLSRNCRAPKSFAEISERRIRSEYQICTKYVSSASLFRDPHEFGKFRQNSSELGNYATARGSGRLSQNAATQQHNETHQ